MDRFPVAEMIICFSILLYGLLICEPFETLTILSNPAKTCWIPMIFVFDAETIPDFDLMRRILDEPDMDDELLLDKATQDLSRNQSGFLPPMYHRLISWVGLWIENSGQPAQKAGWNGENEKEGLQILFNTLSTYKDFGLIHHNGRGFDLPLLTYRAMKHGLQVPLRLNSHDIRYRFSKANLDLMDEFSNYGASSYPKLKHLGYLIDLPFKQTAEGNEVLAMYRRGEMDLIEHYCYEDVMATYIIWLRLRYTCGEIQEELFENLNTRAVAKLLEIQSS